MASAQTFDEADLVASICRESFSSFVKEFWLCVPGAEPLIWSWYLEVMCDELQALAERVFKKEEKEYDVVFNISPGTGKSSIASILFQPWTWTRMPGARHICASHTTDLVLDLANKSRDVLLSDKYRKCFPEVKLRKGQDAKGYYINVAGGSRFSCTVAGKTPTGLHAHFLNIDDPIDPKKATSSAELKIAEEFLTRTLPSRKILGRVDYSVTFLVAQRLHEADPSGVMLSHNDHEGAVPVRHVCLPAELPPEDKNNVFPENLREKYVDGLMDPIRLNRKVLRDRYAYLQEYGFAGQYLQRPVSLGGGLFKDLYFNQRVKAAPYHSKRIRYWDRASSVDAGACYTAGVLMARDPEGNFYVEDVVHGQWAPDERNQKMRATALRDRGRYGPNEPAVWVEAEGGSSGRDAWKGVARALAGFRVREDRVTGSKETRAEPWSSQLAAGNVYLVEGNVWDVNGYVAEHLSFPRGRLKDRVDASTGAFNILARSRVTGTLYTLSGGSKRKKFLKIVSCSFESLKNLDIDPGHRCLLVAVHEPAPGQGAAFLHALLPENRLEGVVEGMALSFADLDPADHQEGWARPVEPYGLPCADLVMTRDIGKQLWAFITRKRDPFPDVIVMADQGNRISASLACAVSDTLRLPREKTVTALGTGGEDDRRLADLNRHVQETVKASRELVVF